MSWAVRLVPWVPKERKVAKGRPARRVLRAQRAPVLKAAKELPVQLVRRASKELSE